MAKKRFFKRKPEYSATQKYEFHKKRSTDRSVTENQRAYSRNWVCGFSDPHYENNLSAAQAEYKNNKKYMKRSDKAVFLGDINGMKAATNDKEAARKAYIEQHRN